MDTYSPQADGLTGRQFWRSLEERLDDPHFIQRIAQDFPEYAEKLANSVTRRHFLTLLGASLGLAGVAGCSPVQSPREKIVPYTRQPEQMVLGKPLYFATAMSVAGTAMGLLVESHEGRPTKVEGNPSHPTNLKLGATDAFAQASVLSLYDPDRSRTVIYRGRIRSWGEARVALRAEFQRQANKTQGKGSGFRILTGAVNSPTLAEQIDQLLTRLPEARHISFEPAARDGVAEGARLAFGEPYDVRYDLTRADVIVALDADFLSCGPGHLQNASQWAARRRPGEGNPPMSRLYAVEPTPTGSGLVADHRLIVSAAQVEQVARLLARNLEAIEESGSGELPAPQARWVAALANDLRGKSSAVIVGEGQPPAVHVLGHAINAKLGNLGKTVLLTAPEPTKSGHGLAALAELAEEMDQGKVETLLILDANPVYAAPTDFDFVNRLKKVPLRIHLGLYNDETAEYCDWHIPQSHFLESWGDARSEDGTASIVQPLIAPLFNGTSAYELFAIMLEDAPRSGHAIVRDYWDRQRAKRDAATRGNVEAFWRKALHDGFVAGTAKKPVEGLTLKAGWADRIKPEKPTPGDFEIIFRSDPTVLDGRFANNGWLQELPKPVTKITWENAIFVSPGDATKLGLRNREGPHGGAHGDGIVNLVELTYRGKTITAPAWMMPGQADGSITVHFGYGRSRAGKLGSNIGYNAYSLWHSAAPYFANGATLRRTGGTYTLASTQVHHSMAAMEASAQAEARHIIRHATLEEYKNDPHFASDEALEKKARGHDPAGPRLPLTLYPDEWKYDGYKWGMSIDTGACMGCSACVVACQSENNIPVVGKTEVSRGHEMHWLRIDRYYTGPEIAPTRAYFQPLTCMHCENAPCELVCPVEATTHSIDGINEMTYNRCVGTRYCSNNCPYKVRRFNFLQYTDYTTPVLKLLNNPDVTIRSRGVMEKCTYCVQRVRGAEIEARNEGRLIRDGDVVTACQAACPTGAIVFGDLNSSGDKGKKSRVRQRQDDPLNYGLLTELNTNPRTTYLAVVRNPNPEVTALESGEK